MGPLANLNQAEIRVCPSQFDSAANRVRRVPAREVFGHLKSRKDYNEMKFKN